MYSFDIYIVQLKFIAQLRILWKEAGYIIEMKHATEMERYMQSTYELLDLVDENDQVIGQKLRTEIYAESRSNFRVVNAFVMNQNGQLWIPRRTAHKSLFPLCLDMSMGGHVQSGESYEEALQRELQEELNFDLQQVNYREMGHLSPQIHAVSAFMKVYEIKAEAIPDYNREDFVEYYWLTPLEAIERIENGDPAKGDLLKIICIFYIYNKF